MNLKLSPCLTTTAISQEARRRGRKIGLFFIDGEILYQACIEQIDWLMNLYPENTERLWLQVPFAITNAGSYFTSQVICWDESKRDIWMRDKVPYSIQSPPWNVKKQLVKNRAKGLGFYDVAANFQRLYSNTAILMGVRASESRDRYHAVTSNPGYKDCCWSTKMRGSNGNVYFYPLYDWEFSDIWRYIYDNKLRYSRVYDYFYKSNAPQTDIRVSALVHEFGFKSLHYLPEFEPDTYDRLIKRIPGIQIQTLYGQDLKLLKTRRLPKEFKNWRAYRDFLLATYPDDSKRKIFEQRFATQLDNEFVARQQCRQLMLNDYENNVPVSNKADPRAATLAKWRERI